MPSRNIIREDVDDGYYHIYARGNNKRVIFRDTTDKIKFISLFERYLSKEPHQSNTGEPYPHFRGKLELLTYCLMDNHFHLFLYQGDKGAVSAFMRSLMTSYARYFNLRHKRTGSLVESRYKSSRIYDDDYLTHISRYIHLNPRSWKYYPFSSINFYRKGGEPLWLNTQKVLSQFSNKEEYLGFLYDYEDHKAILDEIKYDLADR